MRELDEAMVFYCLAVQRYRMMNVGTDDATVRLMERGEVRAIVCQDSRFHNQQTAARSPAQSLKVSAAPLLECQQTLDPHEALEGCVQGEESTGTLWKASHESGRDHRSISWFVVQSIDGEYDSSTTPSTHIS